MKKKIRIEDHIGLIHYIIRKYFNYNNKTLLNFQLTKKDLYQQGKLGLLEAIERYDDSRKNKFSTYACEFIKGYIFKLFRNNPPNFLSSKIITPFEKNEIDFLNIKIDFEKYCKKYLNKLESEILYDYIFLGMSFKEIAIKNNLSNMTISRIYMKNIQKMEKYFNG